MPKPKAPSTLRLVRPALLPGSLIDKGALQICGRCERPGNAGGGVSITPKRWICAVCWKASSRTTKGLKRLLQQAA